jgi:hypothetical protein
MEDHATHEEEYEEVGLGRYAAIAVVVAVVLAAGAFFAGRAAAGSSGPSTLADAVTQAQDGKLPCGGNASATPAAATGTPGAGARPNSDFLVQAVCNRNQNQGQSGFRRGAGGVGFGGPGSTTGRITAISGSTLTIQGQQGSTKVKLGSSTTVRKLATGAKADLKAGANVIVSGGGQSASGTPSTVTILPAGGGQ